MAEKDKIYRCLNPVGTQLMPVKTYPLAPRLDTIEGKTIYISIGGGGEQDITIPLPKKLQEKFPNVNWQITRSGGGLSQMGLTEEQMKTADGLIRGVVW